MQKDIKLPEEILAFELLSNANISEQDKMLVLTGIDFSQKSTLFDQTKRSLKKFKGEQAGGSGDIAGAGQAIKLEPAFLAENEEALAAAGYYRSRRKTTTVGSGFSMSRGNRIRGGGRGFVAPSASERNRRSYARQNQKQGDVNPEKHVSKLEKPLNLKDANGQYLMCHNCGSYRHMFLDCPHSWENMQKNDVYYVREQVVMFTGYDQTEIQRLGHESRNCVVLDTACMYKYSVWGQVVAVLSLKSNFKRSENFLVKSYSNLEEESASNQLNVYCFHISLQGMKLLSVSMWCIQTFLCC